MVFLLFAAAPVRDLMSALDEVAKPFQVTNLDPVEWYFPSNENWRVLARFDDEALETFTENERELIYAGAGKTPSAILNLTLNDRLLHDARKATKTLVEHLLGMFYGIADDRSGEDSIWNLEEIRSSKHGVEFLENAGTQILRIPNPA